MLYDADIFRAMMEIISMQALPGEVFARRASRAQAGQHRAGKAQDSLQ